MNATEFFYIDIHTHNTQNTDNLDFMVQNLMIPEASIPAHGFLSAGIHPWHSHLFESENLNPLLEKYLDNKRMIAIGECGLDRSIDTPIEHQINIFIQQLKLAQKHHKPLIIHAVRTYSEILQILKQQKFQYPVIFHNYQGNIQQTSALCKSDSYFSLGERALNHPKINERLRAIPPDRLFLETDTSAVPIQNIYLRAASILNIEAAVLAKQIFNNFKNVFENELAKQDSTLTGR